jgi:hypothetical protein
VAATVRTPVELFADAAELATAGRAARWLDQLVDDGRLTEHQRARLAAEDGAGTLATLLRRVELAGHDPRQVLTDAVENRPLDDARQLTNVLHARITQTTNLDPVADTYADRIPAVDDPQWSAYLTALARAADNRQADLGSKVADEAPQWAVEALGPVPRDGAEREQWEQRAAGAAAYRELVGNDALAEALGPAPQPGQPEVYAAWRSAWRALGRPEADRAEGEMSTGQLRMRVRAYDREQAWAAPYVANELAGVRQAAASRRHDAALRAAEADADGDDGQRTRFCEQAEQAAALADVLDERIADLEAVDAARAHWYAHTAETRAAADRARAELSARQANDITLDAQGADATVTPDEWLAAHDDAIRAEDPHREITAEHDLTDVTAEREHDQATASASNEAEATRDDTDQERDAGAAAIHRPADDKESIVSRAVQQRPRIRVELEAPGPAPLDIRQEAINEPERADGHDPDIVRIPSSDETAESVRRAQRALAEMKQRQAIDAQHTADEARERDDELARWHADTDGADDRADGHVDHDTAEDNSEDQTERTGVDAGPVLELSALDD